MMLSLEQNDDKAVKELDAELQVIGIMIFRVGQFYTFFTCICHLFTFCPLIFDLAIGFLGKLVVILRSLYFTEIIHLPKSMTTNSQTKLDAAFIMYAKVMCVNLKRNLTCLQEIV